MRERRGQSTEAEAGSRSRELSSEERLKIEALSGNPAAETTWVLIWLLEPVKDRVCAITGDNGKEFAGHGR